MALRRIWRINSTLKVSTVEHGVFFFEFGSISDCNKILFKQHWNFNEALMVLYRLEGDERPSDLNIKSIYFFVQIHGLQLHHMIAQIGKQI